MIVELLGCLNLWVSKLLKYFELQMKINFQDLVFPKLFRYKTMVIKIKNFPINTYEKILIDFESLKTN